MIRFLISFFLVSLPLHVVFADNLEWYPDQTSFAPTNGSQSSWFDTLNWFNLAGAGPNGPIDGTPSFGPVPSFSDHVQLIGEDIVAQPPAQQAYSARHVVFGDFVKQAADPENNVTYSGGSATVDTLYVSGDWTLDFGTNLIGGATGGLQVTEDDGLQIGYSERSQGSAHVQVIGPGMLSTSRAGVGSESGGTPTMTVDGTGGGTTWKNAGMLTVGAYGSGSIVIQNGAALTSGDVNLGWFTDSVGNLSVTGVDAVTNTASHYSGDLEIGLSGGSGGFSVTGGATATLGKVSLAAGWGSNAQFTVSGAGSEVSVAQSLSLGKAGNITVNQGGQLLLDAGATFNLAGYFSNKVQVVVSDPTTLARFSPNSSLGQTTIQVTNGASVQSENSVKLSTDMLATTNLTIDGPSTTWTASKDFELGSFGTVHAAVTAGAQVGVSGATRVAIGSASWAMLTVNGANSKWSTNSLLLGQLGSATAIVEDGGVIEVTGDAALATNDGSAVLVVTGANSTFAAGGSILLGNAGRAAIDVDDGGTVTAKFLQIAGTTADPIPVMTIRGAGSSVEVSDQFQFDSPQSALIKIEQGGHFAVDGYAVFGGQFGAVTAILQDPGSQWTNGTLSVSNVAPANIFVSNGAYLQASRLSMSINSHLAQSTIEISDPGSRLEVTGNAEVGYHGQANISVLNGGSVYVAGETLIAQSSDATAKVSVDGPGERWTNDATISVGQRGNGTFAISGGAIVKSSQTGSQHGHSGFIGESKDGMGKVTVSDAGSLWQQDGILAVGYSGKGTLDVLAGAAVKSDAGYIGQQQNSIGTATISGVGSSWTVDHELGLATSAGNSSAGATGVMNIDAGGTVSSESGSIAPKDGSAGAAIVSGSDSVWRIAGALNVGTDGNNPVGGLGLLHVESSGRVEIGTSLMLGDRGSVDVSRGAVTLADAAPIYGAVHLGAGSFLGGIGPITGDLINTGGTISPGFSPGSMMVNGSFRQGAGGILSMELLGPPFEPYQSDKLHVTGDVWLGGILDLHVIDGFLPQVGQTFNLIVVGENLVTNDLHIQIAGVPSGFRFTTAFVDDNFQLTVTAVPEPGTFALGLLGIATGLLAAVRQRRQWTRKR